jgi:hypothetical protein
MTILEALKKNILLCYSRFPLVWVETGRRAFQLFLSLGFASLAIYTLIEGLSRSELDRLRGGSILAIARTLIMILLRRERLILRAVVLTLFFSVTVWLLIASFFQAGIFGLLARDGSLEETAAERTVLHFCHRGTQDFFSFLLINLSILFFASAGTVSCLLILKCLFGMVVSWPGTSDGLWVALVYALAILVVCGIVTISLQFLEVSKLFVSRFDSSLWNAWNLAAEFFFVNLGRMTALSTLIHMVRLISACAGIVFLVKMSSVLGTELVGVFLLLMLIVYLGYRLVANYLYLVKSGSLLTLISEYRSLPRTTAPAQSY